MASASSKRRAQKSSLHIRRVIRMASLVILLFLILLSLLVAIGARLVLLSPVTTDAKAPVVLVTIPPGANVRQIAFILSRKHVVRQPLSFVLAAKLEGVGSKLRAGHYEFSPAMPPRQIADLIALGETATDFVTVPEGFTVRQIARRLAQKQMADEKQFLFLAQTQGQTFHEAGFTPPSANLEGYLFPDTYRIPKGMTEREIIMEMLSNFQKRLLAREGADIASYPGGLPAVITLASLVEREAETPGDRPLIAAVLSNRLKRGMRLQCDATVQYILPQHKTRLFYSDLRVESPYNTYLHAGLPPTPIANPGIASIESVLHPAHVNSLFYVARPDGSHVFTTTLAAHDRAIAAIRAHAGQL